MSYLYRTGNGRNNIAFTTTANSSTKYLRRTSTGRNNIVWTTIPQGSTYNILNRTGTGRNSIAWGNLNIPIPGVALSTKNPGDVVKIKENGTFVDFLVLIHNYPASGRTLLLRKDLHSKGDFAIGSLNYNDTTANWWCENTYYNTIDSNVKSKISYVNIALYNGTHSARVFLLSAREMAENLRSVISNETVRKNMEKEGTFIPYFDSNSKRIVSNYESLGTPYRYYTRSPYHYNMTDTGNIAVVSNTGTMYSYDTSNKLAYRPAFTLPSSILVNSSNQITG